LESRVHRHKSGDAYRDLYPPPDYLLWEITLKCNFKCLHCAGGGGRARGDELSTKEALEVCDEIADLNVPGVALMGGEPLLRKDWPVLASRLRSHGINVGLITNGFLFNEKAARVVKDTGLCQVAISLDAANPEVHNFIRGVKRAFEGAVRAIKIVDSLDILYPTVITSVNKYNMNELDGILEFLLENTKNFLWIINYSSEHYLRLHDEEWVIGREDFVELARFIHENRTAQAGKINITGTHGLGYYSRKFTDLHDYKWEGCVAGTKALGLRSNGDVTGCLILADPFIEGNVRKKSLRKIWNGADSFSYTRRFDRRRLRGKCRGCPHSGECGAGCTNIAYCFTGSIYEAPFCLYDMEKKEKGRVPW